MANSATEEPLVKSNYATIKFMLSVVNEPRARAPIRCHSRLRFVDVRKRRRRFPGYENVKIRM